VVVNERSETAFYLVTKQYSGGKPTLQSLSIALKSLLVKMKALNLTKLGIPKIGCGFDGLDWKQVKDLIVSIFAGTRISITVCIPSKVSISNYQIYCTFNSIINLCKIFNHVPPPQLKVYITPKEISKLEAKSDILLFIDLEKSKKNDWTDDLVNKVNAEYPSLKEK
jgi:hypothetical protein